MTPDELRQARAALGLTGEELGRAFEVSARTVRAWEGGHRNGKPAPIPKPVAVLLRLALKSQAVRRELGIGAKA